MLAVDSPLLDRELHGKDVVSKVDRWVKQNYVFRIGDDNPPAAGVIWSWWLLKQSNINPSSQEPKVEKCRRYPFSFSLD